MAILWSHLLRCCKLFPYIPCLVQMKICHNVGVQNLRKTGSCLSASNTAWSTDSWEMKKVASFLSNLMLELDIAPNTVSLWVLDSSSPGWKWKSLKTASLSLFLYIFLWSFSNTGVPLSCWFAKYYGISMQLRRSQSKVNVDTQKIRW